MFAMELIRANGDLDDDIANLYTQIIEVLAGLQDGFPYNFSILIHFIVRCDIPHPTQSHPTIHFKPHGECPHKK